jgi:hypothetical protein
MLAAHIWGGMEGKKQREKNYAAFNVCTMESVFFLSNNYKSEGCFLRLNSSTVNLKALPCDKEFLILERHSKTTCFQSCQLMMKSIKKRMVLVKFALLYEGQ